MADAEHKTDETFSLDLQFHHPTCDPRLFTESLGLEPTFAMKAGQVVGSLVRTSTVWHAQFALSNSAGDFPTALERLLVFFDEHSPFLLAHTAEGGEAALHVSLPSLGSGFLRSSVSFEPYFLQALARSSIRLQIQTVFREAEPDPAEDNNSTYADNANNERKASS